MRSCTTSNERHVRHTGMEGHTKVARHCTLREQGSSTAPKQCCCDGCCSLFPEMHDRLNAENAQVWHQVSRCRS